jgi:selenocysteine-specific elongation factor
VIVGLAGHIDHGKTALVRALTGVEGDRLKEEKARGVTIDLGFAFVGASAGGAIGFIDVPGHERFVHTMLAGASGIDYALVTIAADDGVMPQTREHLTILNLLGVDRGVVAVTKADLADHARLAEVISQARDVTRGTTLADAEVFAVSARTMQGVEALRAHLDLAAGEPRDRSSGMRFRLAVDRTFTLAGVGVVVTGTVLSGFVGVGDRVIVSPSGLVARVRSLHAQNQPSERAHAGDRCALNLAGPDIAKEAIRRGDVVLDPILHAPTDRIDVRLRVVSDEPKAIGAWFPVRLHHGAADVGAHIVPLGDGPIAPGGEADAQLALDRPIAAAAQDRFVVRDVSAKRTIGGGRFLDLRPPARRRRTPERRAQRAALAIADPTVAFAALVAAPPFAADLEVFSRDRGLDAGRTEALAAALDLTLLQTGDARVALAPEGWRGFCVAALDRIAAYHAENPDHQGVGREQLRLALEPRLMKAAFAAALQTLAQDGRVTLDGAFVRLPSHAVRLAPEDEATWEAIAPMLAGAERFRPPRVRDVAERTGRDEADLRRLLKLASRMGRADEIAHDHFFLRGAVQEMTAIVADLAATLPGGVFTAAQFRDRVENGRKVAIQILEFFDRHGVTLRRGDLRRVNPHRLDLFGSG